MPDSAWSERRVLVTGAGGFVGSWLTHALVRQDASVTVVLRDESAPNNLRLLGLTDRVNVVRGSITDYHVVERALNEYEVDTCFHLAAQAIVGAANRSPLSTFESNIRGTWTVLEACRASSSVRRVVVASSDKAYGAQPDLPYHEDAPLLATAPYDASKACTDTLARSYRVALGLPVAVARCANIYGGGDLNFSRLVPGTIRSALSGERPIIRSDGTPERDYLHVDDAVAGYLALADRVGCGGAMDGVFNFGSCEALSVLVLVRRILQACGRPELEPDVRADGPLRNEIDRQYLDSSKAEALLGWKARVPLDEGLRRTVRWYRWLLETGAAK